MSSRRAALVQLAIAHTRKPDPARRLEAVLPPVDDGRRACKNPKCARRFEPARAWQDYCRPACRSAHWRDEHPTAAAAALQRLRRDYRPKARPR